MSEWYDINRRRMPPSHKQILFLDHQGKIWEGNMCYGMHEPWFCVLNLSGEPTVLNDLGIIVTHWIEKDRVFDLTGKPGGP